MAELRRPHGRDGEGACQPGIQGWGRFGETRKLLGTKKKDSRDWLSQKAGIYVLGTRPPQQTGTRSKTDSGAQIRAISRVRANAAEPFWNGGDTGSNG